MTMIQQRIEQRPPKNQAAQWQALFIMALVLLLAAALRVYHITQQSLWFDEAFAWNIVMQDDMFPRIAADTHPPLYYLLLRAWVGLAGDSPLVLRYLSALISIATVVLTYRTGLEIAGRRTFVAPALAALALALADAEIFLAQETRNYTLYTFFTTLSMWCYLRWLRRPTRPAALWWALSTAALVYTHYQGTFIPALQGLHILLFLRGRQRVMGLATLIFSGLLFLPWFVGVTIPQAQNAIANSLPFAIPSNWHTLLELRQGFLGSQWPLMLVVMAMGVYHIYRRATGGMAFLVLMWFALPFGVLFFGNYFADLLTDRKLLIIVPALALMLGFGLGYFQGAARALLLLAVLIYGLTAVDFYRAKEPWDDIAGGIIPYVQPQDIVTMEIGVGQYPLKYYWQRGLPPGTHIVGFPFLGDPTMAPTTDWFTYYNAYLPGLLTEHAQRPPYDFPFPATVWMVFWSQEETALTRLREAGYARTLTLRHDLDGHNIIETYRYDWLPPHAPPLTQFENGLSLLAAGLDAPHLRADLWWAAPLPTSADYTTSVLLFDADERLVAQLDSPPALGTRPTSTWGPDEVIYDPKALQLVTGLAALPPGTYRAAVQVYQWRPEGLLNFNTVTGERLFEIGWIEVDRGE